MNIVEGMRGAGISECFRQHYRMLCYFAYYYLQKMEKAEDVVGEIFMHLLEDKLTFRDEEHLKRWLYCAVRNACINHIRSAGIRSDILMKVAEDREKEDSTLFNNIVRAEVYRQILDAVEELPKECARIFRMAYIDGLDNQQIAAQLNITVHTVKSQKNKAKILLRQKLKDLYPLALLLLGLC